MPLSIFNRQFFWFHARHLAFAKDKERKRAICRITSFVKGNYESVSMYCYLHGCNKCVSVKQVPPHKELMQWALYGHDLGLGKEHRTRHMAAWPKTEESKS